MIPVPPVTNATVEDPEDEDSEDDEFQTQLDCQALTSRSKRMPASTFKKSQTKVL